MKLEEIIDAWIAKNESPWESLDADERVCFALRYVEKKARSALDDLEEAIYAPERSAISPAHALNHVRQVFSC